MESLDSLREDSRLGPWLATVARRHSWRLLERRRRERVNADGDLSDQVTLLDESESVARERVELLEWLHQGLVQLDKRCHDLLLALYFEDEKPSYADVARRLKMRVGSVGPTRARCLARLREILEK